MWSSGVFLYNRADQYLSWFAGSGITFNSDPEKEYEECLMKVAAFEKILKSHPAKNKKPIPVKWDGCQNYRPENYFVPARDLL